jgi:uncharacterized protein
MSKSLHDFAARHSAETPEPDVAFDCSIHAVSNDERRQIIKLSMGAVAAAIFGPNLAACASPAGTPAAPAGPMLGFKGIAPATGDMLKVPEGYVARALTRWGDPVGIAGNMPAFKIDASNTPEEQAVQQGMHHDGMHYFALDGSKRGLLVTNHEYVDDGLLHKDGHRDWTAEKVRKSQASHGLSVIEIAQTPQGWQPVRPSAYARRVTAHTAHRVGGPAAGHPLMRTAADPQGQTILGTFANCASGITPWGTYIAGEENWHDYFAAGERTLSADEARWKMPKRGWTRWADFDPRFDTSKNPNEFHRFGWIVELDPMDPNSAPVKRTALGRAAHEGAWVAVTADNRAVVYSGEDAAFEYIYKFVSRDKIRPAGNGLTAAQANRDLLDHGTLYVARFNADGTGDWLPMVAGTGPLTAANGFPDQGAVVIRTRQASDLLGATTMDRPEWLAVNQSKREVFCSLTNNSARGTPTGQPVNPANPRANNTMGNIIRWREGLKDSDDFDALKMRWDHFILAGDPKNERPEAKGNIKGDAFGSPDGLAIDGRGVLWIQTDVSARSLNVNDYKNLGNNQMLACDLNTGEVRRFLVGPTTCEITGLTFTPDMRTMFLNIQHPGETPSERSDASNPTRFSNWPDYTPGGRPRSSTVVVQRADGGLIGS